MLKHLARSMGFFLLTVCLCAASAYGEDLLTVETAEDYDAYLARYASAARPQTQYVIDAADYTAYTGQEPETLDNYCGMEGPSLYTWEEGSVTWRVTVQEDGVYQLFLRYYTAEGKGKDITRTVMIDGFTPHDAAIGVKLRRVYVNESDEIAKDASGNELRPWQVEKSMWSEEALLDASGYHMEALCFYLSAGTHEITLVSKSEPLVIHSLTLGQEPEAQTYEQVLSKWQAAGYTAGEGIIRVEAETASAKSSPMLYARADRSSVAVSPSDPELIKINTIGGDSWKQVGQWIEWTIEVPDSGLYSLTLHARQDFVRGLPVIRSLTLDGQTPFKEAQQLSFYYHSGWRYITLADESGEPYLFYLEKGTHTLRLTNVLGDMAQYISQIEKSVANLNEIYRRVVMITGVTPDGYRDYQLAAKLPELRQWILDERDAIQGVLLAFESVTERQGNRDAPLANMMNKLTRLSVDIERMIAELGDFRTLISSVGTWLMEAKENPLQLDMICLTPAGETPSFEHTNFIDDAVYEASSLLASYTIDYNTIGSMDENAEKTITVWVATGRDQANIIKTLADQLFTPQSGINVELALVDVNSLLPAILSGQGPDVAMMISGNLPMNYAMRGAVADLKQFDDFDEIATRFHEEALVPFTFRDACYALPETLSFPMLFYRKDILNELGLSVPETWDDLKAAISVLAKNNMWFGLSSLTVTGQATMNVQTPYTILLYQMGGEYYTQDGQASALDSAEGIAAFKELTLLYSDYTLEKDYDFTNYFRSGIMPLGIADLSTFNTLQVFAPELDGMWGFTQLPGTIKDDGTVDHTSPSGGMAVVIMENSDEKEAAWEYLKWWTSADTQVRYGRELESLMGAAARYSTANLEALELLPWDNADLKMIMKQYDSIKGVPEVPGGYYTSRCLGNAFYDVTVAKNVGAREALIDQVAVINSEISYKRREFGIDKTEVGQ